MERESLEVYTGPPLGEVGTPRVITLTTDFGLADPFVGAMKGVILGINPDVHIVDLSHGVEPFNIFQGAIILRSAYRYFPRGTIHVVVVDPGVGGDRRVLLAATQEQLFVAPDNGVLSFVFSDPSFLWAWEVTAVEYFARKVSSTFHGRDIFAPVAAWLSTGLEPEQLGNLVDDPKRLPLREADHLGEGVVAGEVIYVDGFGNLITNIDTGVFWEAQAQARGEFPRIEVGGTSIEGLTDAYQEAPRGRPSALFNSWGHLEVFIPRGNASRELGIGHGAEVRLSFV